VEAMRGSFRRLDLKGVVVAAILVGAPGCGGDDLTGPPAPDGAIQFAAVTAGYFHSCGLTPAGRAYCWGSNTWGTLGDGTRTSTNRPRLVAGGQRFKAIESGSGHTCGVTTAGQAYCWGLNDEGQVGEDWEKNLGVNEPRRLPGSQFWVEVSAGHDHSCGLTSDGEAWCWGDNSAGHLGSGDTFNKSFQPLRVAASESLTTVIAGYYQSCALARSGRAYCWGSNAQGQIGDGTNQNRLTPVPVAGDLTFRALGGGDAFMCGITTGGATWCWGSNRSGELGDPSLPDQVVPVRVEGLPELGKIYGAGGAFTLPSAPAYACGLTSAGEAWCWGGAIRGGLWAAGTDGPIRVESGIRFRNLALGAEHLCGVTAEGWAFCGGGNYAGQLGDGTGQDRSSLVGVVRP
jgi:alpha-tubulin suppressor-like RCC1 family protein